MQLNCRCLSSGPSDPGTCGMTITGAIAVCDGTCQRCTIEVHLPPEKVFAPDWLIG